MVNVIQRGYLLLGFIFTALIMQPQFVYFDKVTRNGSLDHRIMSDLCALLLLELMAGCCFPFMLAEKLNPFKEAERHYYAD